jgi:MYXO-CTERM domain-containing protein
VAALNAVLRARVEVQAESTSSCSGSSCEAEGRVQAKSNCSVAAPGARGDARNADWFALSALGLAIGFSSRRRRRGLS